MKAIVDENCTKEDHRCYVCLGNEGKLTKYCGNKKCQGYLHKKCLQGLWFSNMNSREYLCGVCRSPLQIEKYIDVSLFFLEMIYLFLTIISEIIIYYSLIYIVLGFDFWDGPSEIKFISFLTLMGGFLYIGKGRAFFLTPEYPFYRIRIIHLPCCLRKEYIDNGSMACINRTVVTFLSNTWFGPVFVSLMYYFTLMLSLVLNTPVFRFQSNLIMLSILSLGCVWASHFPLLSKSSILVQRSSPYYED